jgi:AAA15 family ATPase/GTPase
MVGHNKEINNNCWKKGKMVKDLLRIVSLKINNIKNVVQGIIDIKNDAKGSILGIYGQNGSGKTVVVDCMVLLKCLLSGKRLPSDFYYYIHNESETAKVQYGLKMVLGGEEFYGEYEVELRKVESQGFCICHEKLSTKPVGTDEKRRLSTMFVYSKDEKELFGPRKLYQHFARDMQSMIAFGMGQQLTQQYNEEKERFEVCSFLFSRQVQKVLHQDKENVGLFTDICQLLSSYGMYDMAVVESGQYGLMALNLDTLPVHIDWPESIGAKPFGVMLKLSDVNVVEKELFPYIKATIRQINFVLRSLVPEIELVIYNDFDKLMERGKDGVQFEIITIRDGARVPLRYESAGIKKIISISSSLVACYNRESYCLVVDELDSGVYEYLLGECLEVMQGHAKGQMIFTSHNLRPLEVLPNESLVFTTVNPEQRYIKTTYIKNTQNKRLSYLRSIKLGGQKEKLYHDTDIYEIDLAMRKAGRVKPYD